eukprot:6025999-Pyramimonas_sp.AAC.1
MSQALLHSSAWRRLSGRSSSTSASCSSKACARAAAAPCLQRHFSAVRPQRPTSSGGAARAQTPQP